MRETLRLNYDRHGTAIANEGQCDVDCPQLESFSRWVTRVIQRLNALGLTNVANAFKLKVDRLVDDGGRQARVYKCTFFNQDLRLVDCTDTGCKIMRCQDCFKMSYVP